MREIREGDAEPWRLRHDAADGQKIERHGEAAAQGLGQRLLQAPQPRQPLGLRRIEPGGNVPTLGGKGLARQQRDVGGLNPLQIDPHRAGLGKDHCHGDRAGMGQADAEVFDPGAGENRLLQHTGPDREIPRVEFGPKGGERAFRRVAPDQQAVAAPRMEAVGEQRLFVRLKEAAAMGVEPIERCARERQNGLDRAGPGRLEREAQAPHQRDGRARTCRAFGAFLTRHGRPLASLAFAHRPGIGSRTTREALVLASSFPKSRAPPFGMML
ncbi:hypothetical protein BK022_19750 [Methylorubrum extorquens]|uniref:Uncharacterized protein n=1 Tax=Methylorubrum extorquens TaxID=408 RepID=A0A1S1P2K3_METEX|nr:hypothetical protein BK022_19750 [Methylorubrum extorquens]